MNSHYSLDPELVLAFGRCWLCRLYVPTAKRQFQERYSPRSSARGTKGVLRSLPNGTKAGGGYNLGALGARTLETLL